MAALQSVSALVRNETAPDALAMRPTWSGGSAWFCSGCAAAEDGGGCAGCAMGIGAKALQSKAPMATVADRRKSRGFWRIIPVCKLGSGVLVPMVAWRNKVRGMFV